MAAPVKQWGVTPPVSTALPTPPELAANDELIAELKAQNNFEAPAETERRKEILVLIQRVTSEFVRVIGRKKKLSQAAIDVAGGKIFTSGSYRLGVYGPGSDIDTLVVAPKHVLAEDFFSDFPTLLERMSPPGAIEKLTPVPDAFVPIIKIEFSGISIDLLFARLLVHSVPLNLDLKNNDLLRGLDERGVRSVNGPRVTDEILSLVPQHKTFRLALRAIKLWAQRGVAWAMLVARPVLLKQIEDGPLQMKVWNPTIYHSDRCHLMPIITPAYPSMCATHNISQSTKTVLLRELKRGEEIVNNIFAGNMKWHDLFTKHSFFTNDYKYYLSITTSSTTKEAQSVWSGLVESKLRHLVGALAHKPIVHVAHPFPKGFERVHICRNEQEMTEVKNGSMKYTADNINTETTDQANDPKHIAVAQDAQEAVAPPADGTQTETPQNSETAGQEEKASSSGDTPEDLIKLYTTTYYIGLEIKPVSSGPNRSLDISSDTHLFKTTCISWAGYQPGINDVTIAHVRNYDLPDDVFQEGEQKPVRPKRKVVRKSAPAAVPTPPPAAATASPAPSALPGLTAPSPESAAGRKRTLDALD
ncbi:polynucleotide adenylyltransferase, partial [Ascosphaera atra]